MEGQVEQGLREGPGGNLGKCRNPGAPPPFAYLEQRGLVAARNRHFRSDSFSMMVKFVRDEDILRRCPAKQSRGQTIDKRLLKRGEPARVKHDTWGVGP